MKNLELLETERGLFRVKIGENQIKELIPHRPPALLIKEATILPDNGEKKIKAVFEPSSSLFDGHFPGNPILPGHYLQEALAQAAAVLYAYHYSISAGRPFFFVSANIKWRQPIRPGELVDLEVSLQHKSAHGARFAGMAFLQSSVKPAAEIIFIGSLGN